MIGLNFHDLNNFFSAIPFTFMALFPVLNPLGCAFVILALTVGTPSAVYNQLCRKIAINTFILLIVVFFIGTYLLEFFGISLHIVEIGGGSVVAFIGWRLLNQAPNTTASDDQTNPSAEKNILSSAFYPFTMPITAGPGCIAVTLTINAHETVKQSLRTALFDEAGAVIGILLVSITVYFCYRYAAIITRRLGTSGTQVIVRISAFIIFCIGLQICWNGLQHLLNLLN
jgi:multiple antibiotic resistance protein